MRFIYTTLCLLMGLSMMAQERYLDQVFDAVDVTSNVPYGENFTVLAQPLTGTSSKQPLVMDVYQPSGDTSTARPLVIYLHTGNFLPIQVNGGVTGTKSDSSAVEICSRLAKMGYVAVSADYRQGWNPLAQTQPERALGLINAAYRGLQDVRTCIRFFKRDKTEFGDNYKVDTSKIVVWGEGTGGYISLASATLDDYLEIVTTEMPAGKFLTDLNGDGTPDPMVIQAINGDINGSDTVGLSPGGAIPAGDTLALPNHTGYSSDYQLTVNMGGALGDISWMDEMTTPLITFQVPLDQFAPYQSDILVVPTTNDPIVEVQGGLLSSQTANDLGLNDVFAGVTDEWTDAAKAASTKAGHDYFEGLYPFNKPANQLGLVNGSPWQWWESSIWDTIVHPNAGTGAIPAGSSYDFVAKLSNPDMSAEKGRTHIDTVMGFFAPRAVLALGLSDSTTTSIPTLTKEEVALSIAPNPSQSMVEIRSAANTPMRRVIIRDLSGKMLNIQNGLNTSYLRLNHSAMTPGLYLLEIQFEHGNVVEKLVTQ